MQPGAPNPWAPPPGAQRPNQPSPSPADPYAPPQAGRGAYVVPGGPFAAWVEGDLLAVQKGASLPDVCIQCASPAIAHRRTQRFVWNPPWVIFMYLVSPILGVIVALFVQKKGQLVLPWCASCDARRRAGVAIGIVSVIAVVAGIVAGIALLGDDEPLIGGVLLIVGLVILVVAAITNQKRFVRSKRVDDATIWLVKIDPRVRAAIVDAAQRCR